MSEQYDSFVRLVRRRAVSIRGFHVRSKRLVAEFRFEPGVEYELRRIGAAEPYGLSPEEINRAIQRASASMSLAPKVQEQTRIEVKEIPVGHRLRITHAPVEGTERYTEILMKIGPNKFILIDHDRGSLDCGSEVKLHTDLTLGQTTELDLYGGGTYSMENITALALILPNRLFTALMDD